MLICEECEYLSTLCADLVKENAELLTQYHQALFARDADTVDLLREAIAGAELFRKQGRENLERHKARHNGVKSAMGAI
jgi:hypothetical protein